jgi:two-component system chemotaxis sensor kinase CheA
MNEFLEQFLLESRELVDEATRELLALERAPEENNRLDAAFRAFHTLKGGAGIVDVSAMARALHVAEEALSAGRRGR